jgi:outer membrane immunogenic protein
MRRFFSSSLIAAALGIAVSQSAAAAPPPVFSWTGCYVGGNIGYGWAPTTWTDNGLEFASHTATGVIGGGQTGCDYQTDHWVFGIQGMFDAAGLTGRNTNLFLDPGGGVIDTTKVTWIATLTGRVAYVVRPMTILYLKGGIAWVHSKFTECCQPTIVFFDVLGALNDGVAAVTQTGLTVGVGLEHAFTPRWSAFFEYDYIGLGNNDVTFSPINNAPGPFIYHVDQSVHAVLAGVNYRFDELGR